MKKETKLLKAIASSRFHAFRAITGGGVKIFNVVFTINKMNIILKSLLPVALGIGILIFFSNSRSNHILRPKVLVCRPEEETQFLSFCYSGNFDGFRNSVASCPLVSAARNSRGENCLHLSLFGVLQRQQRNPSENPTSVFSEKVVESLLESGLLHPDAGSNTTLPPSFYAVRFRNNAVLRLLLKHDANLNERDDDGLTLLHYASQSQTSGLSRIFMSLQSLRTVENVTRALDKKVLPPLKSRKGLPGELTWMEVQA